MDIQPKERYWITFGWDIVEAEIIGIYNKGTVVEYRMPFGKGILTWFRKEFLSLVNVEKVEVFKGRIVK